jgi:hypothetical protein
MTDGLVDVQQHAPRRRPAATWIRWSSARWGFGKSSAVSAQRGTAPDADDRRVLGTGAGIVEYAIDVI